MQTLPATYMPEIAAKISRVSPAWLVKLAIAIEVPACGHLTGFSTVYWRSSAQHSRLNAM